jgi:hypothetical protein
MSNRNGERLAKDADCSATWKYFACCICMRWRRLIHLEFEVGASDSAALVCVEKAIA